MKPRENDENRFLLTQPIKRDFQEYTILWHNKTAVRLSKKA